MIPNPNHRGEEVCCNCGCTTGRVGSGEDSIYYIDGCLGPFCGDCNQQLIAEILRDNSPEAMFEPCSKCNGGGFSGYGRGYDDVCGECGGRGRCPSH